jgi:hypothetical protein
MNVSNFVVMIDEREHYDAVKKLANEKYPGYYEHASADNVILVHAETTAESVAKELGIKANEKEQRYPGAVLKLNAAHAGYTSSSLWDWLDEE